MMPAAVIGNPHHLHSPDRDADNAEQHEVDDQQRTTPEAAEAGVDVAFDPVVRRAMAVLVHGFLVLRFSAVQLGAFQQNTFLMPRVTGLCGSSSVSHLAWCLRWIAPIPW
jgi:hypothetical protein